MPDGFRIATAFVQVSPDMEGFREQLQAALDEATAGVHATVRVGIDTSDLDAGADRARARVEDLDGQRAEATARLDTSDLDAGADRAHARIDDLDGQRAEATAHLDTSELDAQTDEARARVSDLDGETARARVTADTAEFDAEMAAANAELDRFNGRTATARVYTRDSSGRFTSGEGGEGGGSSGGGGGGRGRRGGGGGGGGGLAGALTMGIGSLLPAVGGVATGLGLAGGVGALAFGGIAGALSAKHQASQTPSSGQTAAQSAATNFSNSVQIQQAQQAVGQAYEQAAQDAVTSAQSIESSQSNLASVQRSAAASQVQAVQSVVQAEQGLEESNYNLSEAQYNLNQAWTQASQQITQLNDQLADSKLNVQQAQLAIQQAIYNQQLVDQNAYSTSLDRQQAALAVAQSQQQLTDAQDQQTAAQTAANTANKAGVSGSQTVIQAQQAVTQATYSQVDAQKQYQTAQNNVALTAVNNAAQIQQAELQVTQAKEQAAYQQQQDAQQIAQAQQNVTNTLKEQQLQAAATASTSTQAANTFAKDMANLTPAARGVVNQILGMQGALKQLEDSAQNAVLPGVTTFLQGVQSLLPTVQSGVTQMGTAMGDAFRDMGKEMETSGAKSVLQGLIDNGLTFGRTVGHAFGQLFGALARLGAQKGATDGLANLVVGVGRGLSGLADSLGKNIGPINDFLSAVGTVIAQMGPALGQVIGLVAQALGPLTRYLNAHPNGTLTKVLGDIVIGMLALKPLSAVVKGPFQAIKSGVDMITDVPGRMRSIAGRISSAWGTLIGVPGRIAGVFQRTFGPGGAWDGIRLRGMSAADGIRSGWGRLTTFFTTTVPGALSTAGQGISRFATAGASAVGGLASRIGSAMSTAASSVGQFVAGFGRQLVTATRATVVWIAEHTAAAATFIAENVAQAASATAAFVAENLATLGIVAGIALLVTAIVYLATHWKQVWADIEKAALWLWHNVLDPMWQGIEAGASWLYTNAIKPVFTQIKNQFDLLEQSAMWLWHNVFDPLWHGIEAGARGFVSGFKTIWSGLESVFKTPVNFLITTVYTKGIEELWNKVVGAVGLGKLHLPDIPHLAGGGVIGGYAPGRDTVPAMLSPGEGVLVPEAVRAIGPGTVHQLNASYGGGRKSTGGHYAGGGIVGSLENAVSSAAGKAVDIAKITAALGTGDTTALVNALSKLVSTTASGNYGQLLLGVPKTLISKMAQMIKGLFSGSSSGGGTSSPVTVSGSVASWFQRAVKLTGVGAGWIPDLETIAHYESSDNPNAIQQVTDVNSASGDLARGIMQTIMATFQAYHQPGTSSNIFDPVANIAASINYIKSRYGNPANTPGIRSLASGGGYRGYDSGGWLMPGDMPVNGLGRPEAVLTPDQSQAFVQLARQLTTNGSSSPTLGNKQVTIQFLGTQYPNAEQMAAIQRQMALALGGAS